MRLLFILALSIVFFSCGDNDRVQEVTTAEDESAIVVEESTPVANVAQNFGEEFTATEVMPAQELSDKLTMDTLQTIIQGTVNEVCQKKGCWMKIANGEEEIMVKFKDYGFFMPKDISGREVVLHGKAYYEVTPVEELQHYAEDAGKSPEEIAQITEPTRELKFLADGVQLLEE